MNLWLWRSRWMAFSHDIIWIPLALLVAFWVRFNFESIPVNYQSSMWSMLLICLVVQTIAFWIFNLYRGIWRFASVSDLLRIMQAVAVGVLISFAVLFIWQRLNDIPRSVMLLYPMFLLAGLTVPRLFYRWLKDQHMGFASMQGNRTLVIGAGEAGELLLRDLLKHEDYMPIGVLDNDERKHGMEIHGVRVLGALHELDRHISALTLDLVILALPSAPHARLKHLMQVCSAHSIPCRILPSLPELTDETASLGQLRDVRIEDLLGRDEICLDDSRLDHFLKGQCILITGAGGSIGSELCRQILRFKPSRLLMLDHGEFNLYTIDQELSEKNAVAVTILGDIRDEVCMRGIFETWHPDVLFNAAAYKHVPLVEGNPAEGIKTNVLGTCRLADIAVEYGCHRFIQVSTDKAVNPANVMGASKRAAEIYCQNLNARQQNTAFITTRFGNVLGSAGSVVPLFQKQINQGGPITVTHPDMTRYFMTIPEAVSLILQAGSMGNGGEIFVLDMGEPVKITDLAEQMIHLSGMQVGKDIEIKFTGLRPGEKLYEELFHAQEPLVVTLHPKIMLSASRSVEWGGLQDMLLRLNAACMLRDTEHVKRLLQELVPEFSLQKNANHSAIKCGHQAE
ncbi:MAG: nucleoside-diphosphate sugar epimerase/dehydratase [Mariprofundaceae bacterium]|nr:nucleoside-diphosphate sugar epimerase/dehydratase [Mariprofundaceae bacterium]